MSIPLVSGARWREREREQAAELRSSSSFGDDHTAGGPRCADLIANYCLLTDPERLERKGRAGKKGWWVYGFDEEWGGGGDGFIVLFIVRKLLAVK